MTVRERLSLAVQYAAIGAMLAVERAQSGVAWNPLSPSYRENPYPTYRRLREKDPFNRLVARSSLLARDDWR